MYKRCASAKASIRIATFLLAKSTKIVARVWSGSKGLRSMGIWCRIMHYVEDSTTAHRKEKAGSLPYFGHGAHQEATG